MENNYNEPIQTEPVESSNPYGDPIQNPYVQNNVNDYSYGEVTEASQEPAAGPDTYSYEELPPTGQEVPPVNQGMPEQNYYTAAPQPAPKTGLAVAALILGIISVVLSCMGFNIIIAIIAIILGAVYLSKKQKEKRGMAIAGLVLGIISIVLFVLLVVLIVAFMFTGMGGVYGDLYNEMYNEILNGMY